MSMPQHYPAPPFPAPSPSKPKIPVWLIVVLSVFGGFFVLCCGGPCFLSAVMPRRPMTAEERQAAADRANEERRAANKARMAAEAQREEDKKQQEKRLAEGAVREKQQTAWRLTTEYITKQLKSPSTADFGSVFNGTSQDYEKCVAPLGNGEYLVEGWVDSQNGFGAIVRTEFIVKIKDNGPGKKWTVTEQAMKQR